jgi:hypothetical protein
MPSPPHIAGYWEDTEESFDKDIPGMVTSVTYYLRIAQDGDIVQIDDHGDRRQGRITRLENNLVHIELGTAEKVIFNTTTHRFTIPRQRFHLHSGTLSAPLAHYLFPYGQPRVPAPLFNDFPNLRVYHAQATPSGIIFLAWLGTDRVAISISTGLPDDTPQRIALDYNITRTARYLLTESGIVPE